MDVIFLGTSQAIPTASRNHTAILLRHEDENILIDCGEGTQRQFRKAGINPCKLTKILITHWHGDHILGIPGLLQTLALNNYSKTLQIYGPRGTRRYMDLIMNMFLYVGKIKIEVKEVDEGKICENRNLEIYAYRTKHAKYSLAYSIMEKDRINIDIGKLRKIGVKPGPHLKDLKQGKNIKIDSRTIKAKDFTFFKKGKKISIIMDTAYFDALSKAGKDADLLICESTYASDKIDKAKEYEHLTAEDAAKIAKKSKAKELVLTHISQRYEQNPQILVREAKKVFKNTKLAEDFMIFKI
jgi:ribonuclease Z